MELFSKGGVCHLVSYKIQGNMAVLILKSTTMWKIEKLSNYMKFSFHIFKQQILPFCDPYTATTHEDMFRGANGLYEE